EVGPPAGLAGIAVPEQRYCRFEARWDEADGLLPDGVPAQVAGTSIFIAGTRADGTRFEVRTARSDELRLDAIEGAGFPVTDATHALFVAFDGAALFRGVDLDLAVVATDGVIHIESGSNDDLLAVFDDNVQAATKLFDDDDGSGTLDASERDAEDVLAE
ncbi:MAG TPA: hypothetical protein VML75_13925, partial [Kofleriaceae bacterium]|nr:hypothetical protein [Kofleriaceae bacterium]